MKKLLKALYIVLFTLSCIVVVGFIVLNVLAPAPTVDSQVTFMPHTNPLIPSTDPTEPLEPAGTDEPEPTETPEPTEEPEPTPVTMNRVSNVYTCLLVGNADLGGTDTLMLGVFDTANLKASLISIPRDTVVYFKGSFRKINTVYSLGGIEALKEKVSTTLAVPIDFYVFVNTNAFKEVINTIGGVWYNVPSGIDYEDPTQDLYIHLKPGYQLLNGADALKLMRCRSDSAYGGAADIGRIGTQRSFLAAMAKQTLTVANADKVPDLVRIAAAYVKTDMEVSDIVHFATQAIGMDLERNLYSATLPGAWDHVAYYQLTDEDVLAMVNSLGIYDTDVPAELLDIVHP